MRILISVLALGGGLLPLAPAVAAPAPGTCWNLTAAQQSQSTLPAVPAVDCESPHTAELLGTVKGNRLSAPVAFQKCQEIAVGYVGGFPAGGPPPASYALPRTAQLTVYRSRNAKRVYCVGFSTNPKGRVVSRAASVRGGGLTPKVCFNYQSWARQKCSGPKNVDMPHVVWVSEATAEGYPSYATLMSRAEAQCVALAKSTNKLAEAWFVPGSQQWTAGNRYAYCKTASSETDSGWKTIG